MTFFALHRPTRSIIAVIEEPREKIFPAARIATQLSVIACAKDIDVDEIELLYNVPERLSVHTLDRVRNFKLAFEMSKGINVHLTPRERQVLKLVQQGMANKEIAFDLHMAERTVKYYVSSLLCKFHVRSRSHLRYSTNTFESKQPIEIAPRIESSVVDSVCR